MLEKVAPERSWILTTTWRGAGSIFIDFWKDRDSILTGRRNGFFTFSKNRFCGSGVDFGMILAPQTSIFGALGVHFGVKVAKVDPKSQPPKR